MTEASSPRGSSNVVGLLLRVGLVFVLAGATVGADYIGWITGDTTALLYFAALSGMVLALVSSLDNDKLQRGGYFVFSISIVILAPYILRTEADRTREIAEWRILLMETCESADPASSLAERCREVRVRADYEPCDYGTTAEQCRRELYRDARRLYEETPIPPHNYGDTLPTGNAQ